MMNYNISVVIPYYNDSPRIERCLASVINQSCKPSEIIIVDDCSSDSGKLAEILDSVDTGGIKLIYLRNEENRNGAYSRNRGFSVSTGEYLALLDADDYWSEAHLSNYIESLDGSDFYYSDSYKVDKEDQVLAKVICGDIKNLVNPVDLLISMPPIINTFFFKREVLDKVSFDESLKRHQDYQFLTDVILSSCNIKKLDFATAYYKESHRPVSQRVNFPSMLKYWDKYFSFFTENKREAYFLWRIASGLPKNNLDSLDSKILSEFKHSFWFKFLFLSDSTLYRKLYLLPIVLFKYRQTNVFKNVSIKKMVNIYFKR